MNDGLECHDNFTVAHALHCPKKDTPTWDNEPCDFYVNLLSDVCRDIEDRTSYAAVAMGVNCSEINDNW